MRYLFILLLFVFSSCEKLLLEDLGTADPHANFDYLWNEIDRKYSYFALKGIDWNAIRDEYRSQLSEGMSEEELFTVLAEMMNELRDDHSNLFSPFNISRYNLELQYPSNYRARTVEEFYLPDGRITGSFFHDFLADGEIAYVRYNSFSNPVEESDLNHLMARYADTKGMILDLRNNGGGSILNITSLLRRFASQRTLCGQFITRNGPNHEDFGEPADFYIGTFSGLRYENSLVVLIDRGSYSATTMFAVATKAFPQIVLMGDTTGGGGGLPNGGQLPNGWTYRFSISQLIDLDGNNHAESGVAPDVISAFDWNDLTRDEIIDDAITYLLQ